MHAADSREVSNPGGPPPDNSDNRDKCQDAENALERKEVEGAAKPGNDTLLADKWQ